MKKEFLSPQAAERYIAIAIASYIAIDSYIANYNGLF